MVRGWRTPFALQTDHERTAALVGKNSHAARHASFHPTAGSTRMVTCISIAHGLAPARMNMRNIDLSRLSAGSDVWELDILPWPHWIVDRKTPAYRPLIAWCMSRTRNHFASLGPSRPGESAETVAFLVITGMLRRFRTGLDLPGRILVRDLALEAVLAEVLPERGIALEFLSHLSLVDEAHARFLRQYRDPEAGGYLRGVDPMHLLDYSRAAIEFFESGPWRVLTDSNLVGIQPAPMDMHWCAVSGFSGGTRGFSFYDSPTEHQRFLSDPHARPLIAAQPRWRWSIDPGLHVPNVDLDLWPKYDLRRIDGRDFPLLELMSPGNRDMSPGLERVRFVTALLRALADIGRKGIDAEWMTKTVPAEGGPVTLRLTVREAS